MTNRPQLQNAPAHRQNFRIREFVLDAIRTYFKKKHFLEVDTPLLVPIPSMEPYLEVFETMLLDQNRQNTKAYFTTSPEYAMKKLLAQGYSQIFQICKAFRNAEGESKLHNPEFTLLEWYQTNATYQDLMVETEELFTFICENTHQKNLFTYQGQTIDLTPPWPRLTVTQAFYQYTAINVLDLFNPTKRQTILTSRGYSVDEKTTSEQAFNQILLNEIEPKLARNKPTFLYDYPAQLPSLARRKKENPDFVERVELYIAGIEIGNGFSELVDYEEQKKRLEADQKARQKLGKTQFGLDQDFLSALKKGLPECAGMALGVDRLVMLFADTKSVQEVMLFPASELF